MRLSRSRQSSKTTIILSWATMLQRPWGRQASLALHSYVYIPVTFICFVILLPSFHVDLIFLFHVEGGHDERFNGSLLEP